MLKVGEEVVGLGPKQQRMDLVVRMEFHGMELAAGLVESMAVEEQL